MIERIRPLWSPGVSGHTARRRRRIELCNQLGLFGAVATVPYQLFYCLYEFALYQGVFFANLMFMAGYLTVLPLNHRRQHTLASHLLLANAALQLFVVTWFIGTDAGVNLYYFTLASILPFLHQHLRPWIYALVMASFGGLYALSRALFTSDQVPAPVPSPWGDIMYAASITGALTLMGVSLYLFHRQIDQAEEELMLSNEYLETLSNTDPLTGLANRRALDAALQREWSRHVRHRAPLSVIMFDVDHFKRFNDRYGHAAGDRCLQQIAAAAKEVVSRPSDVLVRYGGEEFALVLPGTASDGARQLGERLCRSVEALQLPDASAQEGAWVTVSAGVASVDTITPEVHVHGVERLVKCADEALYMAKAGGRNQTAYQPYLRSSSPGHRPDRRLEVSDRS